MANRVYEGFGEVMEDGTPKIYEGGHVKEFFRLNPGERFSFTYKIVKEKDEAKLMRGYYHACILPNMVQGLRNAGYIFNPKQAEEFLKPMTSVGVERFEFEGEETYIARSLSDFSFTDWNTWNNELIIIAANDLGIDIPPPRKPKVNIAKNVNNF